MAARATSQAEEQLRISDRQQVLRRTIRALPQPMLDALLRGLDRHGDQLVGGRLFKSRTEGGCAVGVMLLELDPELRSRGRLRFWLRDRWRRGTYSYRGALSRNPRLKHLEWIFDSLVEDLRRRRRRALHPPGGRARAGAPPAGGRSRACPRSATRPARP